jgi:hypothetical protein
VRLKPMRVQKRIRPASHTFQGGAGRGSWTPTGSLGSETRWVPFLARNACLCCWPTVCDGYAKRSRRDGLEGKKMGRETCSPSTPEILRTGAGPSAHRDGPDSSTDGTSGPLRLRRASGSRQVVGAQRFKWGVHNE